jgi:hypothetical protein
LQVVLAERIAHLHSFGVEEMLLGHEVCGIALIQISTDLHKLGFAFGGLIHHALAQFVVDILAGRAGLQRILHRTAIGILLAVGDIPVNDALIGGFHPGVVECH